MIHTIQFPKYVRDEQPIHRFTNARGAESNGIRKRSSCAGKGKRRRKGMEEILLTWGFFFLSLNRRGRPGVGRHPLKGQREIIDIPCG
ncbi:hypothetical protein CEXT_556371 [Caerostris extrusa]|uniref:Uncharacterized protein n=1 Tax=Caerostris extrusa TaxID=172846 RepID=A0AAV4WZ57_CAEEX|nr:hypothetical protein CEXT_556371 [Caerostris extrusa]